MANLKLNKGQTLIVEFQSTQPTPYNTGGQYPKDVWLYNVVAEGRPQVLEVTDYLNSIMIQAGIDTQRAWQLASIPQGNRITYEVSATTSSPYTAPQPPEAFGLPSKPTGMSIDSYRDELLISMAMYYAKLLDMGYEGVSNDALLAEAGTFARGELITRLRGDIS